MKNIFYLVKKVIHKSSIVKLLREIIYPDGIYCSNCGSRQLRRKSKKHVFPRQYKCSCCGKHFSETEDTILAHCKLDVIEIFLLIVLLFLKFSYLSISHLLGINYKSAYRLGMKIKTNLFSKREEYHFTGETEMDEVYVTAGNKGHLSLERESRVRGLKQRGRGTYDTDRPPIFGIVNRDTCLIKLFVCVNLLISTIEPIIKNIVIAGSIIYTDEYCIYNRLTSWGYTHKTVCHSAGEYALDYDGDGINEAHCNTVEGLWSLLRQYLRQFRGVRKDKLKYYVNFFEYSYNANKLDYSGEKIIRDMIIKKVA